MQEANYITKYTVTHTRAFNIIIRWEFVFDLYPASDPFNQHLNHVHTMIRDLETILYYYQQIDQEHVGLSYKRGPDDYERNLIKNTPELKAIIQEMYNMYCGETIDLGQNKNVRVAYDSESEMLSVSLKDQKLFEQHLSRDCKDTYYPDKNMILHKHFDGLLACLMRGDPDFRFRFSNNGEDVLGMVRLKNTIMMKTGDFNKIKFVLNASFETAMNDIKQHMTV